MDTIKGKAKAWLAHSRLSAIDLARMAQEGNHAAVINALAFTAPAVDMTSNQNWVHVGFAEISLTLLDTKHATEQEIEKLRQQLQATRAENQRRENAILDRISKLQAIEVQA